MNLCVRAYAWTVENNDKLNNIIVTVSVVVLLFIDNIVSPRVTVSYSQRVKKRRLGFHLKTYALARSRVCISRWVSQFPYWFLLDFFQ